VGLVKIPFTYPPWKVNGFMVAGEPSPDWTKAHTYPPELSHKIGRVNLGSNIDFMRYNTEDLLEHLKFDCDVRTQITREMLGNQAYDFFMVVYNAIDAATHRFWKFTDDGCPNYKESFIKYAHIIRDVYQEVDKSIGQILKDLDDETMVFIMSDHGAARKPLHFFHINGWLSEMGYLCRNNKKSSAHYINDILKEIKNNIPPLLRHLITHAIKTRSLDKLSTFQTKANDFDWHKTKAYAVNLYTTYDGIVLNLKGRQRNGVVEPGAEADSILRAIRSGLLTVRDSRTGKRVIERIHSREKVFNGTFSERMPDLIIQYSHDYRSGPNRRSPLFTDVPPSDFDFQSGDHDENGIFIAFGPHIRRGLELPEAKIQDLAPTILYSMGLSVPSDMDGEVMADVFEDDFVTNNPVRKEAVVESTCSAGYHLSETEEDSMKEQLRGLGYM
jgi:predicted AlkP superfamily phosphohydrolase/phosphomutase